MTICLQLFCRKLLTIYIGLLYAAIAYMALGHPFYMGTYIPLCIPASVEADLAVVIWT
jgi:hypothetical protein